MTFYDDAKRWWQSRTIWFGKFLIVAGLIAEYVNNHSDVLQPYFGSAGPSVSVLIGVATIILRALTSGPIVVETGGPLPPQQK